MVKLSQIMYRVFVAALLCIASIRATDLDCTQDNGIVDESLTLLTKAIPQAKGLKSPDITQRLYLVRFLNIGINLFATNGTWSVNALSRHGDTMACEDNIHQSIEGFATTDLAISYDQIKAKFWFMEIEGKMELALNPIFGYYAVNGTEGCRLASFKLEKVVATSRQIKTEGFTGWLVGKLLNYAIASNDVVFTEDAFGENFHQIFGEFSKVWCDRMRK